jgi:hypothetical protein
LANNYNQDNKKTDTASSSNEPVDKKPNPTPFINASTAVDAYTESNVWLKPYFDPINEFERIARNKPSDKITSELPKITDGTMAAIVQEQPKRIIQQVPSGIINCKDYPEYAKIADLVLFQELVPRYNRMGSMLQKSWNMVGKAMTWGRSASYTFYTMTNGVLHTDFVIPYAKDVLSEKGKVFAPDSNIGFLRSWYQKRDIQATINREKMMEENIKGYKSDWDLKLLQEFMEGGASAKPADQQTPAEREKGDGNTGGFEVIHAFQEGKGAEFYSFGPRFKDGQSLRTKINKDPRGKMPLDFLYCNIDLSNPMGRGQIELSGGVQNLIDQQMQMFQFLTTLMMGPPLQVWGSPNKASLKFRPNAVWDMGANPNSSLIKPYEVNNNAIQNFPNNYALLKSQIMNLNSTQDHSISADAGNPAQSKTQAGVQAAEQRLGISDNYLRKQYEEWFQSQSETSINIYFSEMTGKKTLKLDGEDLKEITKTPAKKFINKDGLLEIPYKEINDVIFHFEVDASSSEVKENTENAEKLTEVLKIMQESQDPTMLQKIPQVVKLIIDEIGAEGTDDLFPELDQKDENGMPTQQPPQAAGPDPQQLMQMVQQMVQEAMQQQKQQPKSIAESIRWTPQDLTPSERAQVLGLGGVQADPSGVTPNQTKAATDTMMAADKQAHDTSLAIANHAQTAAQPPQMPGGAQDNGGKSQGSKSQKQPLQQSNAVDTAGNPPALDAALSEGETQVVHELLQRGFNEQDAEQAVVMLRQGTPPDQVIQILGAKYARA